jgi:hypothetical protein
MPHEIDSGGLDVKKASDHKTVLKILSIVVAIAVIGFFADFGHGLKWLGHSEPEDFLGLMARLLFLTLITERIIEFYKLMYLTKGRNQLALERKLQDSETSALEKKALKIQSEEYHAETRRKTTILGFCIGAAMALVGIRVFTGMFEFEDASGVQIILFDIFEVLVMGAIMAGGSKGVNTMISALESFAKPGLRAATGNENGNRSATPAIPAAPAASELKKPKPKKKTANVKP